MNYHSGVLYQRIALERHDKKAGRQALELFLRAGELRQHLVECEVSESAVYKRIAEAYFTVGEYEKAVELLKKHNHEGINNDMIGYTLASVARDAEQALPYLSDAFGSYLTGLCRVCVGYANAFALQKQYDAAIEILLWWTKVLSGLKSGNGVTVFDKYEALILGGCAAFSAAKGDEDAARQYLRNAIRLAKTFDAAPEYSMKSVKFNYGEESKTVFDNMGETALQGVKEGVETAGEEERPMLRRLWEEQLEEQE